MAHELILIVDDNEQNRKLARDVLEFAGFRTLEAAGGGEGLSLAVEHHPDLILMDIRMPDMKGTEVLQKLREDERVSAIPRRRTHLLDDEGRPRAVSRRRLRRLPREADPRPRVPGPGPEAPGVTSLRP